MALLGQLQVLNLVGAMAVKLEFLQLQTDFKEVFINLSRIIECLKILLIIPPGGLPMIIAKDM